MNSDFDSGLSPKLCAVMLELGYADLTPIQAQSIPVLLAEYLTDRSVPSRARSVSRGAA